jgi:hypothetical protein
VYHTWHLELRFDGFACCRVGHEAVAAKCSWHVHVVHMMYSICCTCK